MKKYLFFLLFLAIGTMSCQKDIEQGSVTLAVEQPKVDYFNAVTPKPSPNDDVVQRIDAFKARLVPTSNFDPVADAMSVGEAIWGIEAVLNQRFSNASKPFIHQQIDSASFTVPLTMTGDISTNDVAAALASAKAALKAQWDGVREASKHIIVIDVSLRSKNATTATFTVASSIGIEQMLRDLPPAVPFGPGEGWYDGDLLGKCGGLASAPFYVNSKDAATKIVEKWTERWVGETYQYYHTDVVNIHVTREGPGGDSFHPFYVNKWIYSSSAVGPICLTDVPNASIGAETLNTYLEGVPLLIDAVKPSSKTYITMAMEGGYEHSTHNIGRFHQAHIYYGIAHLIIAPKSEG
jgi:hypothetical protein